MVFNSLTFFAFFAVVLAFRWSRLFTWRTKKMGLLIASYLFYASWNPPFVALLCLSTVVDWVLARRMNGTSRRGWLLFASLMVNLGLLATFKYSQFLLDSFQGAVGALGVAFEPVDLGIVLPVGISFYTFQTLSWTIDVYRGKLDARSISFLDFALFVAFFPQLVAGPIVRAVEFLPQLRVEKTLAPRHIGWGLTLLALGLFEKTALADALMSPVADVVFAQWEEASLVDAWAGALAFSGQIFFDFAGYSTCAIGVAMTLGFALPDNFRFPYGAIGFSDFWRRWHISLSSWLRDYLYISLGGNRKGERRRLANLMTTMLLGGLWHGAAWTFVLWGFLHGLFLILERAVQRLVPTRLRSAWLGLLVTQLGVLLAWVPFRAESFESVLGLYHSMVAGAVHVRVATLSNVALVFCVSVLLYGTHVALRRTTVEEFVGRLRGPIRVALVATFIIGTILSGGQGRAFIYFQF